MIKKFSEFNKVNESQYPRKSTQQDKPNNNDTINYSKEILEYIKGSIEDIEDSIFDCENGAIDEKELKSRMRHILKDNIEEEIMNYLHEYFEWRR